MLLNIQYQLKVGVDDFHMLVETFYSLVMLNAIIIGQAISNMKPALSKKKLPFKRFL